MNKFVKLSLTFVLLLVFAFAFTGCQEKQLTNLPKTEDKMRTYYQIFPYSFADSNGDGIGDLNGITAKLDYIQNLGYDGLWLTPVHQSTTYHKYDVVDYYSIDKQFGTIQDYDRLVDECHKRGMTILLDLVLNHTSSQHEWFKQSAHAFTRYQEDNEYYGFYNFRRFSATESIPGGWERYSGNVYYECPFWGEMPDLNLQNVLDNPNGKLAQEITNILRYWLIDRDIDGFRLDAVTSYFSGNPTKNTEFLTWLNKTAKSIKPDCYIVGEGSWGSPGENRTYQSSGVDSFFAFQHGYNANGTLSFAVRKGVAVYMADIDRENFAYADGGIPATFISNHDVARAYGISMAGAYPNNIKVINGLMAMLYGTTFSYYGDEVGMAVLSSSGENSYKDEDKRQPMPWGDEYQCKPVSGSTAGTDEQKYPLGNVQDQLEDKNSLLNYIARANAIRRSYPAIARNVGKIVYSTRNDDLCIVAKGEGESKIFIVWNANAKDTHQIKLGDVLDVKVRMGATLSVDINKTPKLSNNTLTIPAQSFVILEIVD